MDDNRVNQDLRLKDPFLLESDWGFGLQVLS
jgi:hypothetical protein